MTSASLESAAGPARRTVVAAAGATGLTLALAACGSDSGSGSSDPAGGTDTQGTDAQGDSASTGGGSGGGENAAAGGTVLAKTSDIPEGGGKIFKDQGVVVTQPTAGRFEAFSSTCTHQGCSVGSVSDGAIVCPCHNSRFSAADGTVQGGPATRPLPAKSITVSGDQITLA
ncbi:Rieske (2Fe-2S) protein [Streptomyces sp. NPDC004629]|uniref:Rieske (2Fe-2S) protein n=1 Tax=Streptomyces sp. NPDC004629 TaxID=3364705 RepID=UPI0036A4703D